MRAQFIEMPHFSTGRTRSGAAAVSGSASIITCEPKELVRIDSHSRP